MSDTVERSCPECDAEVEFRPWSWDIIQCPGCKIDLLPDFDESWDGDMQFWLVRA